jgi:hypothetical protein
LLRKGLQTIADIDCSMWCKATSGSGTMPSGASKNAAQSRIADARARDIEVRTRQRLNRLVPIEIYDEMIDSFAGSVRSEFAGLAATCTRDIPMRRIIDREVNARLRRIAEHAMAQAIRLEAADRPAGGEPLLEQQQPQR